MDISTKTQKDKEERVAEEYLSSLSDLNCNSKPLINMLTMLADENIEYAPVIVKVVEQHIAKVPADFKLPILYLIDSIVKNVKSAYVQLFSQCIVNIFCGVFEKVNEKVRERMYALRQTWNEVFSAQKLYALDVKVKRMDNNWPITAKQLQPSIHVNPNFLKSVSATQQTIPTDMEEILQAKTRELLELKKRKLELELEATKKHLEEQEKQLSRATESVMPPVDGIPPSDIRAQGVSPQMPANIATAPGLVAPGAVYHHNYRNSRPQPQNLVPSNMMNMPQQAYPSSMHNLNKPKVHPVNAALINTVVRHRDPRLARQQQQHHQQNQQQQQQLQNIQTVRGIMNNARDISSNAKDDLSDDGGKTSSSIYRSKTSRNASSGGSGSESKQTTRNLSSSRSSGHSSKSSSSRDKDKERKRSESKSSTTSSSSSGSNTISNRRKESTQNRHKETKQKCDKDAFEIAPLSTTFKRKSTSPTSSPKTKESKRNSKSRSFQHRSPSPNATNGSRDVDLRSPASYTSPEKRMKISELDYEKEDQHKPTERTTKELDKKNPSTDSSTSNKNADGLSKISNITSNKATNIKNIASTDSSVSFGTRLETECNSVMQIQDGEDDGKKRPLTISEEETPLPKKSKSAKLDALFGSEDVDLRTVMPPIILGSVPKTSTSAGGALTPPPAPMISEEKTSTQQDIENWDNLKAKMSSPNANANKTSPKKPNSSLDDVRAKLAKAAKYNRFGKFEKTHKELSQRFKLAELNMNEDTQEANDEKIRTIITQAQELLQSNSINTEQYKNLVQTVMSINETNKLKEAKRRESLNASKTTKKPYSDDDVNADREAAREAVLKKRIPKLPKSQIAAHECNKASESPKSDGNVEGSPLYEDKNNSNDGTTVQKPKSCSREKRLKQSKWTDRANDSSNSNTSGALPQRNWGAGNANKRGIGFRGSVPHPPLPPLPNPNLRLPQMPWTVQQPQFGLSSAPFNISVMRGKIPPPPQPPSNSMNLLVAPTVPPKPCNSIDNPQADLVRTITIDGMSKEIRIYDQVAIVFMELDQPREIGFQSGQRSISVDNQEQIVLHFNDDYKPLTIDGELHRMRFGFPSRELYIDEHWYEIYFGGPPVSIPIKNKVHILKAEGPPPQVNIGPIRRDLVVGKINMIINALIIIPLFLDAKIQTFRLGDSEHSLQFADNLLTVLLDGEPSKVEYGGLPKSFKLGDTKYFIRFGALPQGVVAGKVHIKDMLYVKTKVSDDLKTESETVNFSEKVVKPADNDDTKTVKEESNCPPASTSSGSSALSNFNIDELFQKLVSSGILGGSAPAAGTTVLPSGGKQLASNLTLATISQPSVEETPQETICPIDLSKTESVKTRQTAIVATLFSGMQCSSCGVRFPPEQTIKYSQHLDWHFRQNRRERDCSRKAHSRKWYYDLSDWVQYEEIEDIEEREKNFFETQQTDLETIDEASNQRSVNSPVPSCAAGPDDVDRVCDVCQEKFEQFYNEELEEWHLRSALRIESKIYHPLCYEDYKASLKPSKPDANEKRVESEQIIDGDDNAMDVVIKIEGDEIGDTDGEAKTSVTIADDDDDDVIVLPNEEPSVTEIDDDDEEYVPVNVTREEMGASSNDTKADDIIMNETAESDVEIQEPLIPFTDLDNYVEKELPENTEDSQLSFLNVKIKEEPKEDDEDDDDGFEDVGTVVIAPEEEISIQSSDTQTQTLASSTSVNASPTADRPPSNEPLVRFVETELADASADNNISMEGDLEPEDERNLSTAGPAPAIPLASLVNKIKINISKNVVSTSSSSSTSTITTTTGTGTAPTYHSSNCNSNESNRGFTSVGQNSVCTNSGSSSIPVISTIPVLCGGGATITTTSNAAAASSSNSNNNGRTVVSSISTVGSNVSNISVIGSYGGGISSTPRYHQHTQPLHQQTPAKTERQPTPSVEESITYDLKPSLQKVSLKKMKKIECGSETSGLCSIM